MNKENKILGFTVIDNETGKEADPHKIADEEEWADSLIYCDIEGFALLESGSLVLLDECGNFEYCPSDRFTVVFDEERKQGEWIDRDGKTWCSLCQASNKQYKPPFCPHCGAKMKGE